MKVELSAILTALSICGILSGFLWWILGRVLTDKKDKLTLAFEIERIKERLEEAEQEAEQDTDKIAQIERDLDVVKEKIKHL